MVLINSGGGRPSGSPSRVHPWTTDPQASPNLRSISLESRTSHVADVCVCIVILTKWSFIEATTADEFKRDTGRVGMVTGGLFVHTHCSVVVY